MSLQAGDFKNNIARQDQQTVVRPLHIDFELYTEGDQDYKKELCALLIDNILELEQQFAHSIQEGNPALFRDACHKVKVTLSMLEDEELDQLIAELRKDVEAAREDPAFVARMKRFRDVCGLIVISLSNEINATGKNTEN